MKKIISIFLIMICILPASTGHAYTAWNIPSYLFDADYYSQRYDDLRAAFGTNKTALYNHWCTYGKREGRIPSPVYNPSYYVNNNADLKQAFGNDYVALYNHWCTYGINEFRNSSELYDGSYYKKTYGDLQDAFGNTSKSYLEHFITYGMNEGRQANVNFNVISYKSNYEDLRNAFGNNMKAYYYHYMKYGITEGRKAVGTTTPTSPSKKNTNTANGLSDSTMSAIASRIGTQEQGKYGESGWMCSAYSMAYCRAYLFNDYREPRTYWSNQAEWSWGGGSRADYNSNSQALSAMKNQINAGKPCVVYVTWGSAQHWVVAFKYSGNGTSLSDFTAIDPWDGKIRAMSNYSLRANKYGKKLVVSF